MRFIRWANWAGIAPLFLCGLLLVLPSCGSSTPGRMDWIHPTTTAPRVGTVYCIRGWTGVFSAGIDEMAKQLNKQGVTAVCYMPEQYPELGAALVEKYKGVPNHEPICFIGHSRGVDTSLIVSRELGKVGVGVDVICCLDSVDETTVPHNVRLCYNYWMPGVLSAGNSNFLRGIPLVQEPGSIGKLFNYDLDTEYRSWRGATTEHVTMDDDPKLQKRIVENIMEVCVERTKWAPPVSSRAAPSPSALSR
jgi:hypothetical protein